MSSQLIAWQMCAPSNPVRCSRQTDGHSISITSTVDWCLHYHLRSHSISATPSSMSDARPTARRRIGDRHSNGSLGSDSSFGATRPVDAMEAMSLIIDGRSTKLAHRRNEKRRRRMVGISWHRGRDPTLSLLWSTSRSSAAGENLWCVTWYCEHCLSQNRDHRRRHVDEARPLLHRVGKAERQ